MYRIHGLSYLEEEMLFLANCSSALPGHWAMQENNVRDVAHCFRPFATVVRSIHMDIRVNTCSRCCLSSNEWLIETSQRHAYVVVMWFVECLKPRGLQSICYLHFAGRTGRGRLQRKREYSPQTKQFCGLLSVAMGRDGCLCCGV